MIPHLRFPFSISEPVYSPITPGVEGPTYVDPTSIAGLQLWLKADAIVGLSDADPVATWEDSSAANNDATQGVAGDKPLYQTNEINGNAAVEFVSADYLVSTASAALKPFSIFVVAKPTDYVGQRTFVGPNGAGGLVFRLTNDGTVGRMELLKSNVASLAYGTSAHAAGTVGLFEITYDNSGNIAFYKDGVADGTATNDVAFTERALQVGLDITAAPFLGLIPEILVYDVVLSTEDRQALEEYLTTKWITGPWPPTPTTPETGGELLIPAKVATVDQGSPEEIAQCVYAVLATAPGERAENPEFGLTPQLFRQGGVDLDELRRAVEEHEPRASVLTDAQFEGLTETVRVTLA